jgi:hypothetical protein
MVALSGGGMVWLKLWKYSILKLIVSYRDSMPAQIMDLYEPNISYSATVRFLT